ncbi:MAG TPA: beta-galactosidase trimerization domain-containing protein [bacterium]|nr:beta-galactosidase trimerization domain-containing protein [bacterium]HRV03631.1 beta-galactosidase trimerization domain-containing protein [Candidatus Ratteibacteria bacterium]
MKKTLAVFIMIFLLSLLSLFADTHPAQKFRSKNEPVIPAPDGTIFCEAEEFSITKGAWQAKNWGENYFAATLANTFLSRKAFLSAPEQCDESIASINVRIMQPGRYLVLARYEAPYRFESQFNIKIEQNGRTIMDRRYGARDNLKIWAFGEKIKKEVAWSWGAVENLVWEGHDAYVDLVAGTAKISIIAGKQPFPAGKRNIDVLMLTQDENQVKTRIEKERHLPLDGWLTQAGDVWMRIKNTGKEKISIKSLSFPGGPFQQHSPYWVHMRNWQPVNVSVEAGQTTEWVEVGSTMDALNDGQWGFSTTGECIIEFAVKNASGDIEKIKDFTIKQQGNLNLVGFADTRYCKKILTPQEAIGGIVENLKKIKIQGKLPEKTLIFASTNIKEFFDLYGICKKPDVYADWRGKNPSQLEQICKNLSEDQRKSLQVISLGDEIGLPAPSVNEARNSFVEYLKTQQVNPEDIDSSGTWNNIVYNPNPKLKDTNPALFYWSKRFQHYYGIQQIKTLTDVLRNYLPNAGIGANFSPHHGGYAHSYLGEVFQWVNCFREDGLTMPWSEDYIWQVPVGSPQMNEINLDLFRAGIRGKPDRKIHYYVMPHWPGNTPNMWKRQFYGALAHGMKIINLFEFHPVWMAYTENHVSSQEMFETVLKSFREYGLFEDIVQEGNIKQAKTGLWFSETADIWSDNEGSFAAGKRSFYITIRNNQIPLDFIVEQDAQDGTLNKYTTIFLTDRHISTLASQKIVEWVQNGGVLFMTAGAGMFDQYNRQNTIMKNLAGIEQIEIIEPEGSRVEFIKQDLPFAKPITEIKMMDNPEKPVPVFGAVSKIKPDASIKKLGEFSDGSPAIITRQYGKGRIIYCAFLPGLSYFKPAIPLKPVDRGSSDDAMAHFLPVDFEQGIRGLIRMACPEELMISVKDKNGNPLGFVETTVIESEKGTVIPVINWSTKDTKGIIVEINADISKKKISLASGNPIKSIRVKEGIAAIGLDVDIADAIIMR